jgi:hypothetical protein
MIIMEMRLIDALGRGYITQVQYNEYISNGLRADSLISVQLVRMPATYSQIAATVNNEGQTTLVTPTSGMCLNIVKVWLKPSYVYDDSVTYQFKMGGVTKTGQIPIGTIIDHYFDSYPVKGATDQLFTITVSGSAVLSGYIIYFETTE